MPKVRPEGLRQWEISNTPSETEPVTFRLLAQCLNQLRHCVLPVKLKDTRTFLTVAIIVPSLLTVPTELAALPYNMHIRYLVTATCKKLTSARLDWPRIALRSHQEARDTDTHTAWRFHKAISFPFWKESRSNYVLNLNASCRYSLKNYNTNFPTADHRGYTVEGLVCQEWVSVACLRDYPCAIVVCNRCVSYKYVTASFSLQCVRFQACKLSLKWRQS